MHLSRITAKVRDSFIMFIWTLLLVIAADQAVRIFFPGLMTPYEGNRSAVLRYSAPYIEFKGKPNALDHNRHGYRYRILDPGNGPVKIAFFGGSTGYQGDPPIPAILEEELKARLNRPVYVANFSVVSSNHRQHLHNILESRQFFLPDIVLFYGGYNETVSPAFYDPRPGYPYNYFFRHETPLIWQWFKTVSPTINALDLLGTRLESFSLTPLLSIRREVNVLSQQWSDTLIMDYFETLKLAHTVSGAFASVQCDGPVQFRFFYQPYQVPEQLMYVHRTIKSEMAQQPYGFDVSDDYQGLGVGIYTDIVHVKQEAHGVMAKAMAKHLLADAGLMRCFSRNKGEM